MSNTKSIFALLVCLLYFFLWWEVYSKKSSGHIMRGIEMHESSAQEYIKKYNSQKRNGSFCNDLPACIRPVRAWSPLIIDTLITKPLSYIGRQFYEIKNKDHWTWSMINESFSLNAPIDLYSTHRSLRISSNLVFASSLILTFIFLYLAFDTFTGFFALMGFALLPLATQIVFIVEYDYLLLLYWSITLVSLPTLLKHISNVSGVKLKVKTNVYILLAFIWSWVGSWIMENTGIALSIALFILAITKKHHSRDSRMPYWRMYGSASIATLIAIGVGLIATYRHNKTFWSKPGNDIADSMRIYGDNIFSLMQYCIQMIKLPFIVAGLCLIILILINKKTTVTNLKKNSFLLWSSCACIIGFMCTVLVGLWYAGLKWEWARELMPLTLLFTWFIFCLITIIANTNYITKTRSYIRDKLFQSFSS